MIKIKRRVLKEMEMKMETLAARDSVIAAENGAWINGINFMPLGLDSGSRGVPTMTRRPDPLASSSMAAESITPW